MNYTYFFTEGRKVEAFGEDALTALRTKFAEGDCPSLRDLLFFRSEKQHTDFVWNPNRNKWDDTTVFTFYWLDGKRDVFQGADVAAALNGAGYSMGALAALDFYAKGNCTDYFWDKEKHDWIRHDRSQYPTSLK